MRIIPLIEVELDCTAGSPIDYREPCGLAESAVCTGALLEMMLVAGRELGAEPVCLSDLVLPGHAPIGAGIRLLSRAYEAAIEVIGGASAGTDWAVRTPTPDWRPPSRRPAPTTPLCRALRTRARWSTCASAAGGALQEGFIVEARRDEARSRLRLVLEPAQLVDIESYALHPLLWEAGIAGAEHLIAGHASPASLRRAIRAASMSMYAPSTPVRAIEVERKPLGASVRWLGESNAVIAEALGITLGEAADDEPAYRRCARIVRDTLGKRITDVHQSLAELGISSIDRARVAAALAHDFGCRPELEAIVASESLAEVASLFAHARERTKPSERAARAIDPDARFVLSPAQQQVWALQAMAPDTPRCHVSMRLCCEGELDEARLTRALDRLLERHASLRVFIDASEEQPLQRVRRALSVPLESLRYRWVAGGGAQNGASPLQRPARSRALRLRARAARTVCARVARARASMRCSSPCTT